MIQKGIPILALSLIFSALGPSEALAADRVDVTGVHKMNLTCVDRNSVRRDGQWA